MPPKRELSEEQIDEIKRLKGVLSADEVKKKYGIGTSRLYNIWWAVAITPTDLIYDRLNVIEEKLNACNQLLSVLHSGLSELADGQAEVESEIDQDLEAMLMATKRQTTGLEHVQGTLQQMQNWSYLIPIGFLLWKITSRTLAVARQMNGTDNTYPCVDKCVTSTRSVEMQWWLGYKMATSSAVG